MRLFTATAFVALLALPGLPVLAQSFEEGLDAYNRGDYSTALEHFKPLAEQGVADAQSNLGEMYDFGKGVPRSYSEAEKWYRRAAEQGHAVALFDLGYMYHRGKGVPQNYIEAAQWYRRAAELGDRISQVFLSSMYANGKGVSQNLVMAYMLMNLVAAQGDGVDRQNRDALGKQLTREQINEGQRLSSDWRVGTPLPATKDTKTWP
ncbi:tetratricopeptide repeat protein [Halomonas sp.]|uniref:tetratricopeptide repeat protein n=1 Tax=Halomonas sp. TaxID=1486246 RepID=UPI00384E1576